MAFFFPWKSSVLDTKTIREVKRVLDIETQYASLAKGFKWTWEYSQEKSRWIYIYGGFFQDGIDYGCAEYVDIDADDWGEYRKELESNFRRAMRRRFDFINDSILYPELADDWTRITLEERQQRLDDHAKKS